MSPPGEEEVVVHPGFQEDVSLELNTGTGLLRHIRTKPANPTCHHSGLIIVIFTVQSASKRLFCTDVFVCGRYSVCVFCAIDSATRWRYTVFVPGFLNTLNISPFALAEETLSETHCVSLDCGAVSLTGLTSGSFLSGPV